VRRKHLLLVSVFALATGLALLGGLGRAAADPSIVVVATTTQLQDLVANVGGSRVHVVGLLRPNVDPHEYEPKPSDVAALAGARLIVTSGVGLDTWMDKVIANSGTKAPVVVASRGLPIRKGDSAEPAGDPHWWHDPTLFSRAAANVAAALERADPSGQAVYAANLARYEVALRALDRENAAEVATVSKAQRKLVTNHDAFGYLAARYGITIVGSVIPSLSTAAEPNARDTARLIARIKSQHVKAIFTESSLNPKLEEQIAHDAHVAVYADLYGDTLGPKGSPGATYLGMERWNVKAMVAGFLGRAIPKS
jgi:ABC-type Zn uptake system ZnuABC Zn-binding protein ZnuA